MTSQQTSKRIVVLGAGYTGMLAALATARRTRHRSARVTLVNPSARFTERLRMHQIATGQRLANFQIPDLIAGTGITFVLGRAERLRASLLALLRAMSPPMSATGGPCLAEEVRNLLASAAALLPAPPAPAQGADTAPAPAAR